MGAGTFTWRIWTLLPPLCWLHQYNLTETERIREVHWQFKDWLKLKLNIFFSQYVGEIVSTLHFLSRAQRGGSVLQNETRGLQGHQDQIKEKIKKQLQNISALSGILRSITCYHLIVLCFMYFCQKKVPYKKKYSFKILSKWCHSQIMQWYNYYNIITMS